MRRNKRLFRPKRRYRIKKNNTNAIKAITGVLAVAVLVFVGYSAAGPVSEFLQTRAEQKQQTEENAHTEQTDNSQEQAVILPEIITDAAVTEQTVSVQTTASETEPVMTTAGDSMIETVDETTAPITQTETETTTEAVTEETVPHVSSVLKTEGAAFMISPESMADKESIGSALDELKAEGYTAVIFPMKTEGGIFRYDTKIPFVDTAIDGDDPVVSELSAEQVLYEAESRGLMAVGYISVLTDNNRYGDYRDGSYRSLDDSTWLDASPDNGGKPWISPFDPVAQEYLCDIVTELGDAGFTEIICDDFIFPDFRSSDIELLGEQVSERGDRYLALTKLAQMMTEAGKQSGADVMIRVTANSIIKGYSEVFVPEELAGCHVLVDYSEYNMASVIRSDGSEQDIESMEQYDKVTAVFDHIIGRSNNVEISPMFNRKSMTPDEYYHSIDAVTAMGYIKYYIY